MTESRDIQSEESRGFVEGWGTAGSGADDEAGRTVPAGEHQGLSATFTAEQIAVTFRVGVERVERAMKGELGLDRAARVDSLGAQLLAEILLADRPLADREAALMELGAYTPRSDTAWGLGDKAPGEESDRLAGSADRPATERANPHSSYDPATQPASDE